MRTTFKKLIDGWNAEPNAPDARVAITDGDVVLTFDLNAFQFKKFKEGDVGQLRFRNCSRYRLGPTNDEGWYSGQCRFSKIAPAWGEFYEVNGDLMSDSLPLKWENVGPKSGPQKHFLFYLRDSTFECDADSWTISVIG